MSKTHSAVPPSEKTTSPLMTVPGRCIGLTDTLTPPEPPQYSQIVQRFAHTIRLRILLSNQPNPPSVPNPPAVPNPNRQLFAARRNLRPDIVYQNLTSIYIISMPNSDDSNLWISDTPFPSATHFFNGFFLFGQLSSYFILSAPT